ncbi:MAG TPA: DEAD/DEAH box helicase family protein [Ktedonobacterales bacterium]|nr:DEAD/DEAH box helicase family protein [Ktedonobacterales bacterium]
MPTEADTCRVYVVPKLHAAGWDDAHLAEQRTFTEGRIHVTAGAAHRGKPRRADYLLFYQTSYPLAVVEAKAEYRSPADGMQQAKNYAHILGLLFAYATNGRGIVEYDFSTGLERDVSDFPSPKELWARYRAAKGLGEELENKLLVPNYTSIERPPRYYQQIAINRAIEAILSGQRRVLLTLATGTGKTVIAFQIAWKLWRGEWNAKGLPQRRPRILFLADRSFLVDDPMAKTFAPFGDARIKIARRAVKSREMYFATYQALAHDDAHPGLYRQYAPDFFDLIIVDEAHRGSARDDSSWRDILDYFTGAIQLGLTATPLREDNRDTYEYFGAPVYTYSLKQGIQDGFLAPYQVRRILTDIDAEGYRPYVGQRDDYGRDVPDKEYTSRDFERALSLPQRTEAVARHLTNFLKATDRFAKTLVFCTDQEHADQMRRALSNANADLMREYPTYVARVTSDDGDLGKALLSTFQDVETRAPVILTTSQLLTTGVDAPMVKNIVLFRHVGSMTDFKQIIGRGTRVREDYGKLYFTILDYTGTATQNFADPAFDGDPVRATVEQIDGEGASEGETEEPVPPDMGDDETAAASDGEDATAPGDDYVYGAPLLIEPKRIGERRKLYLGDVQVVILGETVQELDASGKRLRTMQLTDYTGEQVRTLLRSEDDLRSQWAVDEQRRHIIAELDERGIALDHLAAVMQQPEADPFDLLCSLAFRMPILTRRERATRLRNEQRDFFARYSAEARGILDAILDQYATYGPDELSLPDVLHLPALQQKGTVLEIAALFGGVQQLREAVTELHTLLYAA